MVGVLSLPQKKRNRPNSISNTKIKTPPPPQTVKRRKVKQAIWWYEGADLQQKFNKREVTTGD